MIKYLVAAALAAFFLSNSFAQEKTFLVKNGEAPWSDRVGRYVLAEVPERLVGKVALPQQNCGSRQLEVPGAPKFVTMGVSSTDASAFKDGFPQSKATGEKFSIAPLPSGNPIAYEVFEFPDPPPMIKSGFGPFQAGLVLLAVSGESTASAAVVAPAAEKPTVAALVPFDAGSKKDLSIYMLMGQSNMLGRDTRTLAEQVTDPRIGFLRANQWFVAIEPMAIGGTGIGPGISFAKSMLAGNSEGKIGLVPCAVGGTPLSRWEKGADLYENAVKLAKIAAKEGTLKGMLWHQGESDSDTPEKAGTYQARLAKMFEDFRRDVGEPNLPIVVGQLGEFVMIKEVATVNDALEKVAKEVPHVAFVSSKGLTDKGDRLHFDAKSQEKFGERYAKAMVELQAAPK